MANRTLAVTDEIYAYLENTLREPEVLRRLREETSKLPNAKMQIAPEQGQLMALLVELVGAKMCLEIGTFTGYSSTAVALALPPDGRLVACDSSREWTDVARRCWEEAGVSHKIELRLGPALQSLDALLAEGCAGRFDFAFIDADKASYDAYYEKTLKLLRPGGLVALDNALRHGRVADTADADPGTAVIRDLNRKIRDDVRVTMSLVPIADGLLLARKR
ncbi:MAG: class I SAM-dependent methyltransferase [bacterium]|nr:class I SAM-dependent methyltransferase [bacterium]